MSAGSLHRLPKYNTTVHSWFWDSARETWSFGLLGTYFHPLVFGKHHKNWASIAMLLPAPSPLSILRAGSFGHQMMGWCRDNKVVGYFVAGDVVIRREMRVMNRRYFEIHWTSWYHVMGVAFTAFQITAKTTSARQHGISKGMELRPLHHHSRPRSRGLQSLWSLRSTGTKRARNRKCWTSLLWS